MWDVSIDRVKGIEKLGAPKSLKPETRNPKPVCPSEAKRKQGTPDSNTVLAAVKTLYWFFRK
jgi:hypothetical protein